MQLKHPVQMIGHYAKGEGFNVAYRFVDHASDQNACASKITEVRDAINRGRDHVIDPARGGTPSFTKQVLMRHVWVSWWEFSAR